MKRWWILVVFAAAGACSSVRPVATPHPGTAPTPSISPSPVPVAPVAPPVASPVPPPAPVAPLPAPASDTALPRVRVLLARTSRPFVFPQPGRPYRVSWGAEKTWAWGPLTVTVAAQPVWQVGAWKDPASAAGAVAVLQEKLGDAVRIQRTVGKDHLVRVTVRWTTPSPSGIKAKLAGLGFQDAFKTGSAGPVQLRDIAGNEIEAARMRIEPSGAWPTAAGSKSYRGWFDLRVSHGALLVINELNIEAYLRGVVPAEMGPSAFPQLAALEAQAVAARTYTVAHVGAHDDEGYDLCATPSCQVYGGTGVEHPLTDRAVEETAGLIAVYDGQPIDAMYTSTCGGHTEDAAALFPARAAPYLTGVACAWERPLALSGVGAPRGWMPRRRFDAELARRALGLKADASPERLVRAVAAACGGPASHARPANPEELARSLLRAAGLAAAGTVLGGGGTSVDQLLHLADLFRITLDPPPAAAWQKGWAGAAALAVLRVQGIVQRERGEAVPRPDGVGIFPRRADHAEQLPQELPLYERWDDVVRRVDHAAFLPGVTLERWTKGKDVLALVVVRSGGGAQADRRSSWRSWTRVVPWSALAKRLGLPHLARLEVTKRSASGRVIGLEAFDRSGRRKTWSGFAVRQALGLPETFFTFHKIAQPDGTAAVRFLGRGWGHGVGLCQNGAYGLARAGMTFDQILATYYPGTALAAWEPEKDAAATR
ncbi:MAG: SpoIID/LytB domain-containing protein [Acidobacteria bacterium]|nr:SpoIID/LytB domain-containing protein [Acidobacteriota bacterium]